MLPPMSEAQRGCFQQTEADRQTLVGLKEQRTNHCKITGNGLDESVITPLHAFVTFIRDAHVVVYLGIVVVYFRELHICRTRANFGPIPRLTFSQSEGLHPRFHCVRRPREASAAGPVSGAHWRAISNANPFPSTLERPTRPSDFGAFGLQAA